jgi:glycosyltransferase involved in cell wall biosynthesis
MRVLSYLNVSNGDDLERDSGFLFQRALLEELAEHHEVVLVAPTGAGRLLDQVRAIELDWPRSKYGVRLGWPWQGLANALEKFERPDVVLNNQSELTTALRLLLLESYGDSIPVATYFHYLAVMEHEGHPVIDPSLNDLGIGPTLWTLQLEAARHSSAAIIGTNYGAEFLRTGLGSDAKHIDVIPPPVIPGLREGHDDGKTILYNHRLYEHYGTNQVLQVLERVCLHTGAKVIVTDPTQARSATRTRLDEGPSRVTDRLASEPWVEVVNAASWSTYCEVVARSTVGMAPNRPGALWSMSAMDLMSIGRPVLVPVRSGLGHELGAELSYCDSNDLELKLIDLISNPKLRASAGITCRQFAAQFGTEAIAGRFEEVFQRISRAERPENGRNCY